MFLAVIGLVASTALIGFAMGGFHETDRATGKKADSTPGAVAAKLLFVAACCAFILMEPSIMRPVWLQYVVLAAVPAVTGYAARRYLAFRLGSTGVGQR